MNKILKNFITTSGATLLGQLVTFIVTAYYAKVIGSEHYGNIVLAQSIILYFYMIVLFGLQTYGTREVANNAKYIDGYAGIIISFRLIIALMCFLILIIISLVFRKDNEFSAILLIFGIGLFPTAFNMDWIFNGLQEMKHNAVYLLFKNIIPSILILIFLRFSIFSIPLSITLGITFGAIYYLFILVKVKRLNITFIIDKSMFMYLLKVGSPFFISGLLSMVNGNVDKLILGFMRTRSELGIYQSSYTFINFLISFVSLLFIPIFPLLVSYYNDNEAKKLSELCKYISKVVCTIAIPIMVGGIILSKDVIELFYGSQYIDGANSLIILMVYVFTLFIREIYAYQLNAWGMERKYLKSMILSSSLNFVLNLLLIPYYGMIAAALVTLLTEIINLIYMRRITNNVVKTPVFKFLLKALLPATIMGAALIILRIQKISILLVILFGIIIYFVMSILFRTITISEIKAVIFRKE